MTSDDVFIVNVADVEDVSQGSGGRRHVPGVGETHVLDTAKGSTRFLGREDGGPWVYYSERPAGDVIPLHKHRADRVEFLIDGKIEWTQPGEAPRVYAAGTLSFVQAGTVYGYTVLEDARILISFDGPPGINYQ